MKKAFELSADCSTLLVSNLQPKETAREIILKERLVESEYSFDKIHSKVIKILEKHPIDEFNAFLGKAIDRTIIRIPFTLEDPDLWKILN